MVERGSSTVELTSRGRASRDRIVKAATGLMLERGVAATSVDDVLAAAGASKSQLYHYFTGKRDLVGAVIDEATSLVLGAHDPLLSTLDSWEALGSWFDHIVGLNETYGCALGCPLGTLAAELVATDETARLQLADAILRWETKLRDGLAAMRTADLLKPTADVDALAIATMAALQGGLLLAKTSQSIRPLRIALAAALDHIRHAAT